MILPFALCVLICVRKVWEEIPKCHSNVLWVLRCAVISALLFTPFRLLYFFLFHSMCYNFQVSSYHSWSSTRPSLPLPPELRKATAKPSPLSSSQCKCPSHPEASALHLLGPQLLPDYMTYLTKILHITTQVELCFPKFLCLSPSP